MFRGVLGVYVVYIWCIYMYVGVYMANLRHLAPAVGLRRWVRQRTPRRAKAVAISGDTHLASLERMIAW